MDGDDENVALDLSENSAWHGSRRCGRRGGVLGAEFYDPLEHLEVDIGDTLEADATLADISFRKLMFMFFGDVLAALGAAHIDGDVALLAGKRDDGRVALAATGVLVVVT